MNAPLPELFAEQLTRMQPGPPDYGLPDLFKAARNMRAAGADVPFAHSLLRSSVTSWGDAARARATDSELATIVSKAYEGDRPETIEALGVKPLTILLRSHADRLRDRSAPAPMLIDGAFPLGGVGAIVAMPGAGKTLVSVEVSRCVASGEPFMGRTTMQGRVIYACPDSPASTERRLLTIDEETAARIDSVAEIPALPGSILALREAVERINAAGDPVHLIVIDTWDSARSHVSDGYAGQDALIESAMGGLRKLAADLQLSVLIVHHATRNDGGRARGSVVFDARADWIAVAEGDGRFVQLKSTKCRDGERGDLGTFEITTTEIGGQPVPHLAYSPSAPGPSKDAGQDARAFDVLKYVVTHEGKHTTRTLMAAFGITSTSTMTRLADKLRGQGLLTAGSYVPTQAGRDQIDALFNGPEGCSRGGDFNG